MGRRRRRRKRRGGGRSRREALGKARPPRGEGPRRAPLARRARGGGSARLLPRLPPRRLSSWAGGGRRLGALPAAERGEREAAFTSGPPARSEPARLRSAPLRTAHSGRPGPLFPAGGAAMLSALRALPGAVKLGFPTVGTVTLPPRRRHRRFEAYSFVICFPASLCSE